MQFDPIRMDSNTVLIGASGRIAAGDSERLMGVFMELPRNGLNLLVLNSPGGSVVASEALAATIRRLRVPVLVGNGAVCASACFILFAASPSRFYIPGARIGVHSAMRGEYETVDSMAVTTVMARSAAEMGVPNAIIGRMVSTLPGSMAWLTEDELASMGASKLDLPEAAPPAPSPTVPSYTVPATAAMPKITAPADAPSPAPGRRTSGVPKDEQSPSFQQGRADRMAWEQWFASLAGDARLGAEYWTAQRSLQRPGNCLGTPDFERFCQVAKQRLAGPDTRRKTDPQYWWGWNSL